MKLKKQVFVPQETTARQRHRRRRATGDGDGDIDQHIGDRKCQRPRGRLRIGPDRRDRLPQRRLAQCQPVLRQRRWVKLSTVICHQAAGMRKRD